MWKTLIIDDEKPVRIAISKTTMDNALAFMEGRKNGNEVTV